MSLSNHCFIFDLDGTLVDMRQLWEQTYNFLYQKEHGFTLTGAEMKSMFGPPELECHTTILRGRNLYTSERAEELVRRTEEVMLLTLARTRIAQYRIPGAVPCLRELQKRAASVACATGNLESIAQQIVQQSGLHEFFPVMAASSRETPERYQIVAKAKRELEQVHGTSFDAGKTYVIGDSPSDIRAGKRLGYVAIGVTTGHYTEAELGQESPDYLLHNLTTLPSIINGEIRTPALHHQKP